jgi:hypothetical protein
LEDEAQSLVERRKASKEEREAAREKEARGGRKAQFGRFSQAWSNARQELWWTLDCSRPLKAAVTTKKARVNASGTLTT